MHLGLHTPARHASASACPPQLLRLGLRRPDCRTVTCAPAALATAPRPPPPQPPCPGLRRPGRCQSSGLRFNHHSPVLWHPRHKARPNSDTPDSTLAAAPQPPPPRSPCPGLRPSRRQSSGLHFGHCLPVLLHPRHQVCPDSDALASDPPPPRRNTDSPAGARPPPRPDAVSRSSSAPRCRQAGELYFSLMIATCML
jgi:hypothetical protein